MHFSVSRFDWVNSKSRSVAIPLAAASESRTAKEDVLRKEQHAFHPLSTDAFQIGRPFFREETDYLRHIAA